MPVKHLLGLVLQASKDTTVKMQAEKDVSAACLSGVKTLVQHACQTLPAMQRKSCHSLRYELL